MTPAKRTDIIKNLHVDILRLQGFRPLNNEGLNLALSPFQDSFPNASFPLGAVHEFLCEQTDDKACSGGFVAGLLSYVMKGKGAAIWISASRTLFPPSLKSFGLEPDHFVFVDLKKEKDIMWAMEESLKCGAVTAVVGEIRDIDFTMSRRLQLAVEQSCATGFIIRSNYRKVNTTACVSRWKITSLTSDLQGGLPGVGFPKWRVELLRMRNGKPGVWEMEWLNGKFLPYYKEDSIYHKQQQKAG